MDEREPVRRALHVEVFEGSLAAIQATLGEQAAGNIVFVEEVEPVELPFPAENVHMVSLKPIGQGNKLMPVITNTDVRMFYRQYYAEKGGREGDEQLPFPNTSLKLVSALYDPSEQQKLREYLWINNAGETVGVRPEKAVELLENLERRKIVIAEIRDKPFQIFRIYLENLFGPWREETIEQ